tara:strand:- start:544 stop:696 length:153 start_codon:yes stop_codon:yes gene_type:complete
MNQKALMAAVATAVAVAGGLWLYYGVIAKEDDATVVADPAAFRGKSRRKR